jgi:uncharacterized protein (TIGR04551 family)
MRILSRMLGRPSRSNLGAEGSRAFPDPTCSVLGASLLCAAVLSAGSASAQPPPAPALAPPPTTAPAAPAPAEGSLMPPAPPPGAVAPAPPPAATLGGPPSGPVAPAAPPPDTDRDAMALAKQGGERPERAPYSGGIEIPGRTTDVFAEDWWTGARPVFEVHGYYRVRAELFHNFALGRQDGLSGFWPQPIDNQYQKISSTGSAAVLRQVILCGSDPTKPTPCSNNTQAGANMRFRLNPELHISDNLRIMSQIDMLDNLVLGSTPEGYFNTPSPAGGYLAQGHGGYTPLGAFTTTQWAPVAGVNSTTNSITVKRVWGEFMTPVGMLRFGRMPSQWGLGMVANSGDGYDSDWQSTADRIMFVTGIKKYDLYFSGMWDFAASGATSQTFAQQQGQPYALGQLDSVNQWGLVAVRKRDAELQRLDLAKGDAVINGGAYVIYRNQFLANDSGGANTQGQAASLGASSDVASTGLSRRGAWAVIPDLWFQFLYKKFRFEAEGAMIFGNVESIVNTPGTAAYGYNNPTNPNDPGYHVRQFGLTTQSEFRAIEDRLRIQFGFGWASGDPGLSSLAPNPEGLPVKVIPGDRTYSEFAFHPDYRIDLILFRNILSRVEGAYYFRPSVEYDFARDKNGQKLGGGAAVIWSRASDFIQTPGHARDLGVELNGKVYFQSRDGTLNDNHEKKGGFYTQLEYGVLFPLAGLGYLPGQQTMYGSTGKLDTATAQTLRWFIGILY